jgi:hypothetical protein
MKSDNTYLKTILTKLGVDTSGKRRPNNYYLRKISEEIGESGGDYSTVDILVTYTDDSTETLTLLTPASDSDD